MKDLSSILLEKFKINKDIVTPTEVSEKIYDTINFVLTNIDEYSKGKFDIKHIVNEKEKYFIIFDRKKILRPSHKLTELYDSIKSWAGDVEDNIVRKDIILNRLLVYYEEN